MVDVIEQFDWTQTLESEYAQSPVTTALLESFYDAVDQTQNWDNFFDLIWNIDTAVGYGLDVWGRIVGVTRTVAVSNITYFGFDQATPGVTTYGFGIFFSGTGSTTNVSLTDNAFRTLILAKALFNICDGSTKAINKILMSLFPGRGDAYVVDNNDMTMVYHFAFATSPVEKAIVQKSGVLPTPSGVHATYFFA